MGITVTTSKKTKHPSERLFPKFLNHGSAGNAVFVLNGILAGLGFMGSGKQANAEVTVDGNYGQATVDAVKALQVYLGFTDDDVDGNFGPATRKVFKAKFGIHINGLKRRSDKTCSTAAAQPDGSTLVW